MSDETTLSKSLPTRDAEQSGSVSRAGASSERQVAATAVRWRLGVALAIALGLAGTAIGYMAVQPMYESTMLVRVQRQSPPVIYEESISDLVARYESFILTQTALIRSRRVMDMAVQGKKWQQAAGKDPRDDTLGFVRNLSTARIDGSELIQVAYRDISPERARVGVQSIVDAYMQIYVNAYVIYDAELLAKLESRPKNILVNIENIKKRMAVVAGEYEPKLVGRLYDAELERLLNLDISLHEARGELDAIPQDGPAEVSELRTIVMSKIEGIQHDYSISSERIAELGKRNDQIESLRLELSRAQNDLADAEARWVTLSLNGGMENLISIPCDADLPLALENRPAKALFASLGGLGGVILGLATGLNWKMRR